MTGSQQQSQEIDALVEITEIVTGRLPFLEKCESVLDVLAKFTASDVVVLREFDSENSTLDMVASYVDRTQAPDFQVPLSVKTGLSFLVLESNSPMTSDHRSVGEAWDEQYSALGLRFAFAAPVQVDGELFGSLGFGTRSPDSFSEGKFRLVASIATMVGMMIAKAKLQEINESEAIIGRIVSAPLIGPDVFARFSIEAARIIEFDRLALNSVNITEYTYVTEFLLGDQVPNFPVGMPCEITGAALEEVILSRTSQLSRLDELEGAEPKFPLARPFVAAGQPFHISVLLIVGDQVIGTMGINRGSKPFSQEDLERADRLGSLVAGAFADHKAQAYRAEAEERLKESDNRFRQIAENMRRVFWLFDIDEQRMLYVGPNAEEIWGYTAEQCYDDPLVWMKHVHPEDLDRVRATVEERWVNGESDTEFRMVRSDGTVRWILSRGFTVIDEQGRFNRLAGISEDITEHKSAMQLMNEASHLSAIGRRGSRDQQPARFDNSVFRTVARRGPTRLLEAQFGGDFRARETGGKHRQEPFGFFPEI